MRICKRQNISWDYTSHQHDDQHREFRPCLSEAYPIAIKHYQWVKEEIEKLLAAKVICSSRSSWSALIIVVPKGDGGNHLVIDYRALNKVTRKFTWPIPRVEDILHIKWSHLFYNVRSLSRLPSYTIR